MADRTIRSTGNRRAVRNALFRSMMDRRKLRESDLRPSRTILGPTYVWAPRPGDPAQRQALDWEPPEPPREIPTLLSPEYLAACRALTTPPETHPLLRWWRRLLWGE